MAASKKPLSHQMPDGLSTPDGLDTLDIAALIYRLDANVPLLVAANETAKRQLHLGERFPMADPWQWLDARQYPAAGRDHPALLDASADVSRQWHCFHIRQYQHPLRSLKLKVSRLDPPVETDDVSYVLIAIGEIATTDAAPSLLPHLQPHWRQVLGNLPMGVCVIDTDGYLRLVNHAFCEFFGYAESELLNAHFRKLLPASHRQAAEEQHAASFFDARDQRRAVEVQLHDGSSRTVIIEDTISHDEAGRPQRIAFLVDITERCNVERRLEERNRRLEYLATRDDLTGLHNRRFGLELLEQTLERSQRYGEKVAIAMLDLDHFKEINDRHGHAVGDEVLTEFGHFMASALRSSDTLVRWGGEEFLVILPGVDRFSAQTTIDRVLKRLRHCTLSTSQLQVSFSAGVGEYRHQRSRDLLEEVDLALYQAKSAGRGCVSIAPVSSACQERCCTRTFPSFQG